RPPAPSIRSSPRSRVRPMTTRRSFLGTSTLAAAGAVLSKAQPAFAHGAPSQEPSPFQGGTLPPAIAALTPMTAGAQATTNEERRARIEKATRLMRDNRIDALMLTGGTSLQYFTNIRWGLSERMLALVLPVKGTPFIVCPKFEQDRAMEQVAKGPLDKATD